MCAVLIQSLMCVKYRTIVSYQKLAVPESLSAMFVVCAGLCETESNFKVDFPLFSNVSGSILVDFLSK